MPILGISERNLVKYWKVVKTRFGYSRELCALCHPRTTYNDRKINANRRVELMRIEITRGESSLVIRIHWISNLQYTIPMQMITREHANM